MRVGEVIDGRFSLEALAGQGGHAAVFRARDLEQGGLVALKLLRNSGHRLEQRFTREAEVLATLDHPAIVSYVSHGIAADGSLFLAMEWLEGETLEERLLHSGLTIGESAELVRRVAAALGQAHRRGIVHRDLKPSNLFLVDKRLDAVKVLDFGVARLSVRSSLSRTGVPLGTPSYMAPEQARGAQIDARADVFALGCVLFECLTGRQAFSGEQVATVLLRILFEPPPPILMLRPELPHGLAQVTLRMLDKDPLARPADGDAVAAALEGVEQNVSPERAPVMVRVQALTDAEQRLVSLMVIAESQASADDHTLPESVLGEESDQTQTIAAKYGARFELLLGGKVLWLTPREQAVDQAARAARCALELAEQLSVAVVLVTGWAEMVGELPGGGLVERALVRAEQVIGERGVFVDEATAGLLATRFALSDDRRKLFHERSDDSAARLLLGRKTPCVGRERELRILETIAEDCAQNEVASVALVTAEAGIGKSRLRRELLQRLAQTEHGFEVWSARGDPMTRGVPFALIRGLVRHAAEASEALGDLSARVFELVRRSVAAEHVERVGEFCCALLALPLERESVQLRAARQDARMMSDQLRRALLDLLEATLARSPLLLVIDDVHWADEASLELVNAALERFEERPLMVAAFGRPELHDAFPRLWRDRPMQQLRLAALSERASVELVHAVLGDEVSAELLAAVTAHAAGNAFLLEELIRTAEGGDMRMPESAIAAAQVRLDRLEQSARRVLKAASVFGLVFSPSGVEKLVGTSTDPIDVAGSLASLEAREFIVREPAPGPTGEPQLSFRHPLLREAAFSLLAPGDQVVGHRLAGEWLEAHGETNASVVAEHFERGEQARRAIPWWARAAEQALEANDLASAAAAAERGIACGAWGEELGQLRFLQGEARGWLGEADGAERALSEAVALLERGSPRWCSALAELIEVEQHRSHVEALPALVEQLLELPAEWRDNEASAWARARVGWSLVLSGHFELVERLRELVLAESSPEALDAPRVRAGLAGLRALAAMRRAEPQTMLDSAHETAEQLLRAGDERRALRVQIAMGWSLIELGAYAEAERHLQSMLPTIDRLKLGYIRIGALHNLGFALARNGKPSEGLEVEQRAIDLALAVNDLRFTGAARKYAALILLESGDAAAAEEQARAAVDVLAQLSGPLIPSAWGVLASTLLARDRVAEALEYAEKAYAALETTGVEEGEARIRLNYAEASWRSGDQDRARRVIATAKARVLERAAPVTPDRLQSFLGIPEIKRTLELAERWSVPS